MIEINAQKHRITQNLQNHGELFEAFKIQKQTLNLQRPLSPTRSKKFHVGREDS